jgi:formylglycine-generating enzyme required for sulfatase activity
MGDSLRKVGVLLLAAALSGCWHVGTQQGGEPPDDDADSDTDADVDSDTDADGDSDSDAGTDETNDNCSQEYCDQILIPAGVYPRGADEQAEDPPIHASCVEYDFGDETPQHLVSIDAFCIDMYEVTWVRYDMCVIAGECPEIWEGYSSVLAYHTFPVITAGFEAAEAYCEWIGRRMCTEAEWERAANGPGPDKRTYPWGDDPSPLAEEPLFHDEFDEGELAAVDAYPDLASAEGVHGLVGNAMELIGDGYTPYDPPDAGVLEDPVGPDDAEFRVARGGASWVPSNYTTTERLIIDAEYSQSNYDDW